LPLCFDTFFFTVFLQTLNRTGNDAAFHWSIPSTLRIDTTDLSWLVAILLYAGFHQASYVTMLCDAVANSILASNPSLSNTMLSLNNLSTPICSHQSTLQSILSNSQTSSVPLQSSGSLNAGTISRMLSGNLPTANSGVLIATETVAPCMKGANKNRLTVKEVCLCCSPLHCAAFTDANG
jgi:hypothetical protein